MKTEKSYNVQIWCGLRSGYSDKIYTIDDVRRICKIYIADIRDCISITSTEFMYVDGSEPGVIIGWINYPRFPRTEIDIEDRALSLAKRLRDGLCQERVTITTPNYSYMIEN
jgi:hypothetical protein